MKLKYFCTGIFFLALVSCQSRNEALETALKLAGDNRPELEKVLSHYSKNPTDTLKLKAAKFLIENMPGHYTLEGNLINECRKKIVDTVLVNRIKNHKINDICSPSYSFQLRLNFTRIDA